jgi:lysophospholipase
MGILSLKGALVAACSVASTFAAPSESELQLDARAFPDAPDGYKPTSVDCPSKRPTIRSGKGLSSEEVSWLPKRRNATISPIREFLSRAAIPDFDSDSYLSGVETDSTALPNIGLSFSGGGYRAMTQGAGALAACDSRTDGSTESGHIGGLLQSATYVSALSGGGWLVGSLAMNNFSSVQSVRDKNDIWQLDQTILEGPDNGPSLLSYWSDVAGAVSDKKDAGFERSLTDYWGRTLSYQLIEPETGGVSFTWSSIADDPDFKNGDHAMPILVADGRYEGETIISINTTVYEFNPWEMGSWDNALNAFVPMKYVGSAFDGGVLPDNETCIRGFDNAGFVMGTSSSLFNQIILYVEDGSPLVPDGIPDFVVSALVDVLEGLGDSSNDIADWSPNPFYGYEPDHNLNADQHRLTLVDGGEDLQNIPYYPLIQDKRGLDVIFSFDASADTDTFWPNGTAPIATYVRSQDPISNGTSFPAVPDYNTFVNLGLNTRPTFFGCNATNATAAGADSPAPLIVYVPSYPYVHFANLSTFGTMSMTNDVRDTMIQNGYETATMANSTRNSDWQVCVACAMMHRSWVRTGTDVPAKCTECFDTFCWDGSLNTTVPALYEPELYGEEIDAQDSAASGRLTHVGVGSVFALAAAWLVL